MQLPVGIGLLQQGSCVVIGQHSQEVGIGHAAAPSLEVVPV
jgi:hypothetical protein